MKELNLSTKRKKEVYKMKKLKSVNSNHETTHKELVSRIKDVLEHGTVLSVERSDLFRTMKIMFGYLTYYLVIYGNAIVFFECEGIYGFSDIVKENELTK